jgi:hypothetical protein
VLCVAGGCAATAASYVTTVASEIAVTIAGRGVGWGSGCLVSGLCQRIEGWLNNARAALAGEPAPLNSFSNAGPRVFWSGGDAAKEAATTFASRNGGATLGMTPAGQAVEKATRNLPWSEARPVWVNASEEFARTAVGEVHVFQLQGGAARDSIWRAEYDILSKNGNQITYHISSCPMVRQCGCRE